MKKFIVETYYTCTFKTVHKLNNLNENELNKIDGRTDGEVEVIDVKLNNRKTKKIGDTKETYSKTIETNKNEKKSITNEIIDKKNKNVVSSGLKVKGNTRFRMPDRRKGYIQKA